MATLPRRDTSGDRSLRRTGTSRGRRLRSLIETQAVTCLGVYDVISARIAEQLRASAIYISGYAASAVTSFNPDLGLLTQTEMYDHIARICDATSLPAIADADTGYGGALNIQRTVRLWQRAGAAGLHLEDQAWPKRCAQNGTARIVPAHEMVDRVRAAADARNDSDLLLIARTDCIASAGAQEAIDRCHLYAEAGADALFVNAPESLEQVQGVARQLAALGKPLVFNAARTGRSPYLTAPELAAIGYRVLIFPADALFAAHAAIERTFRAILDNGSVDQIARHMTSPQEFNSFLELPKLVKLQNEYGTL